jgi:hypothetical protein
MPYGQDPETQVKAPRNHRRLFVVASCPILSAVIAVAIVYPSPATNASRAFSSAPYTTSMRTFDTVDRSGKGDRLVGAGFSSDVSATTATFASRWDAQNSAPTTPRARGIERKVLIGCDRAFGPLVRPNFSGRCLASGSDPEFADSRRKGPPARLLI